MDKDARCLTIVDAAKLTKINARIPNVVNLELNRLANERGCAISSIINDAFSCFLQNSDINIFSAKIIGDINVNLADQFKNKLEDYIFNCKSEEFILFYIANIEKNIKDVEDDKFVDLIWKLVENTYQNESNVAKRQILNLLCYEKQCIKDVIMEVLKQDFVKEKLQYGKLELLKSLNMDIK